MRRIADIVILLFFFAIPYYLIKLALLGRSPGWIMDIIFGLFLTGFLLGITYKKIWTFKLFSKNSTKFLFCFTIATQVGVIAYFSYAEARARGFYKYVISEKRIRWTGKLYQADDTLGFKPIPNTEASQLVTLGPDILTRFDKMGFRVPGQDSGYYDYESSLDILFLGCSFTFGNLCSAEKVFPYLVARKNNLSYINAGRSGYGLSQMLILAEKLIPRYKPKYVVVQYSPWLAERSTNFFAPTYYGLLPAPYFVRSGKEFRLEYPVFKSQIFEIDIEELRNKYKENYIGFLLREGIPFVIKEHWRKCKINYLQVIGKIQSPSEDRVDLENFVYGKICDIANKNGTKVIILNIENSSEETHKVLKKGSLVAEADSLLSLHVRMSRSKDYAKEFHHWRFNGIDSVDVDAHPNCLAHEIIAESINLKLK